MGAVETFGSGGAAVLETIQQHRDAVASLSHGTVEFSRICVAEALRMIDITMDDWISGAYTQFTTGAPIQFIRESLQSQRNRLYDSGFAADADYDQWAQVKHIYLAIADSLLGKSNMMVESDNLAETVKGVPSNVGGALGKAVGDFTGSVAAKFTDALTGQVVSSAPLVLLLLGAAALAYALLTGKAKVPQ